jgi:hypothetical protein
LIGQDSENAMFYMRFNDFGVVVVDQAG